MASTHNTRRVIPHTINGTTKYVPAEQVRLPRDLDRTIRTAVAVATAIAVTVAIVWGAASIGDLLARAVHPVIAYGAAGIFDLAWITCMAVEWLARYDEDKAKPARIGGFLALAVAMGAICTHGFLAGGHAALAVGIIGALISAIAKGLWHLTMHQHSVKLTHRDQHWRQQRLSEGHAELAVAAVERELARVRAATEAYREVYGGSPLELEAADVDDVHPVEELADATIDTAITLTRTYLGPDATPAQVAAQLVDAGVIDDPKEAVRRVAEHMVRDGAHHGAPQVTGPSKAAAITEITEWFGEGAPSEAIVQTLAAQGVSVSDSQVRNELSRARRKAPSPAPGKRFGFGAP